MKHFLSLFLLSTILTLAGPARAQSSSVALQKVYSINPETPSKSQNKADSLMANLDKSQISTGVLYDRVAGMAALDVFNLCYNNPDTSSVGHFLQAYYEMHVAPYVTSSQAPSRQVLRDNARYYAERGQVLIGALRYRFNYIDSNAVANNQLRWSAGVGSLLYDVAGRNGSPYLLREVVVGSALADTLREGSVTFRLDPGSIFTNVGATLKQCKHSFRGWQWRSCMFPWSKRERE